MLSKDQITHDLSLIVVEQMVELTKARYSVANMQGEDGFSLLSEDIANLYSVAFNQISENLKDFQQE